MYLTIPAWEVRALTSGKARMFDGDQLEISSVTPLQGCSKTTLGVLVEALHRGLVKVLSPICLLIYELVLQLPSTYDLAGYGFMEQGCNLQKSHI